MEGIRSYRRRGTLDFPMASYRIVSGVDMKTFTHYHPETEIILVLQGDVTMQIGGSSNTFHQGDICIIPSNMIHGRRSFSQDAITRTLVFSVESIKLQPEHFFQKEFVQPLADGRLKLPGFLQPGHPAYATVRSQMDLLDGCRIYDKDYKARRFSVLMCICIALLPYCQILSGQQAEPDPGNEAVKLCMRCIHNNYFKKLTLTAIAKVCHLHPNYLCTVFKAYTGQTVFEYLIRFRVETAAALLRKEDLPMSKIAELVGFRSESLFYQKFKQIMGTTPKAYSKASAKGNLPLQEEE